MKEELRIIQRNLEREAINSNDHEDVLEQMTELEAKIITQSTIECYSIGQITFVSKEVFDILFKRFTKFFLTSDNYFDQDYIMNKLYVDDLRHHMKHYGREKYLEKINGYYIVDLDGEGFGNQSDFVQNTEQEYIEYINEVFK